MSWWKYWRRYFSFFCMSWIFACLVFLSYHVQWRKEQQLLYGRPNTKFDGFQIKVFDRHLAAEGLFLLQNHGPDGSCCESRVFLTPLRGVVVSIQADEDDLTKRKLKFTTTWRRLASLKKTFLEPQKTIQSYRMPGSLGCQAVCRTAAKHRCRRCRWGFAGAWGKKLENSGNFNENWWIWKLHRNRKRKMMKWYEKDVKHGKYSTMFVQVLADVLVDPMSSRFVLKIGKAQQRRHVKARLVPGGWQRSSSPCGRWSWQWRVKIKRAYCWSMQFFDVSCNLLPLETWKMSTLKKWTWLTWQIRKYSSGINRYRYRWNLWFGELRHVPGHQPRVIMSHGFIWASETLVCCYHSPGEEFTSISRSIRIDTCILWSVVPHWGRPGSHPNAKTTPSVLRSFVPTWLHFVTSYDYDFMISSDCGYLRLTWCIGDLRALAAAFVRPYVSRLQSLFASHGQR